MEVKITFKDLSRIVIKKVLSTFIIAHCLDNGYDLNVEYWKEDGTITHATFDTRKISFIATWGE